jgi:hypothetical protein
MIVEDEYLLARGRCRCVASCCEEKGSIAMTVQIQGYLRALAARRPGAERVGPFLAAYDPHSDNLSGTTRCPTTVPTPPQATCGR